MKQSTGHFIPVALYELVEDLVADEAWCEDECEYIQRFTELYIAYNHHRFHGLHASMLRAYLPFNPDSDLLSARELRDSDRKARLDHLESSLSELLKKANYQSLSADQINHALTVSSPHGVRVTVDLGAFDRIQLHIRGQVELPRKMRDWKKLFLRSKEFHESCYQRVFLFLKLKATDDLKRHFMQTREFSEAKATKAVRRQRDLFPEYIDENHVMLRIFRDVPITDLEILFPNREVKMKPWDKVRLGVTGGGGTASAIAATATKVTAATNPIGWAIALAGLVAVIARQVTKVFTQRTQYMAKLAESLYFHSLATNRSVISQMVELGEAEECKEALLAYCLVGQRPGISPGELKVAAQSFIFDHYSVTVNFDIDDALHKLHESGLLQGEDQALKVMSPKKACEHFETLLTNLAQSRSVLE